LAWVYTEELPVFVREEVEALRWIAVQSVYVRFVGTLVALWRDLELARQNCFVSQLPGGLIADLPAMGPELVARYAQERALFVVDDATWGLLVPHRDLTLPFDAHPDEEEDFARVFCHPGGT
jgi:hypothetical protein